MSCLSIPRAQRQNFSISYLLGGICKKAGEVKLFGPSQWRRQDWSYIFCSVQYHSESSEFVETAFLLCGLHFQFLTVLKLHVVVWCLLSSVLAKVPERMSYLSSAHCSGRRETHVLQRKCFQFIE